MNKLKKMAKAANQKIKTKWIMMSVDDQRTTILRLTAIILITVLVVIARACTE